jgi:hypothetical protein
LYGAAAPCAEGSFRKAEAKAAAEQKKEDRDRYRGRTGLPGPGRRGRPFRRSPVRLSIPTRFLAEATLLRRSRFRFSKRIFFSERFSPMQQTPLSKIKAQAPKE